MSQSQNKGDNSVAKDVASLQRELEEVEGRIQRAKIAADGTQIVQSERESYVDSLRDVATEIAPEAEEKFDRQDRLLQELEISTELEKPMGERSPEFEEKLTEFRELNTQLNPTLTEAAQDPAVKEKYQSYRVALSEEMQKVEPQLEELLERQAQISEQFRDLLKEES